MEGEDGRNGINGCEEIDVKQKCKERARKPDAGAAMPPSSRGRLTGERGSGRRRRGGAAAVAVAVAVAVARRWRQRWHYPCHFVVGVLQEVAGVFSDFE